MKLDGFLIERFDRFRGSRRDGSSTGERRVGHDWIEVDLDEGEGEG